MLRQGLFLLFASGALGSWAVEPIFTQNEVLSFVGTYNKAAKAFSENGVGSLIESLPYKPSADLREEFLKAFPPSLKLWPVKVEGDLVFFDHPEAFEFMQRPFSLQHIRYGVLWINGERILLLDPTVPLSEKMKRVQENLFDVGNHFSALTVFLPDAFAGEGTVPSPQKKNSSKKNEELRESFKDSAAGFMGILSSIAENAKAKAEKDLASASEKPKKPLSGGSHEALSDSGKVSNNSSERARQLNQALKDEAAQEFDPNDSRYSGELGKLFMSAEQRAGRAGATRSNPNGTSDKPTNKSTGKCWRYVKLALLDSGVVKSYPGTGSAYQAVGELTRNHGFTSCGARSAASAPLGAVLVYNTGGHGHVEIKTGPSSYTSDFISSRPLRSTATVLVPGGMGC